MSKPKDHREIGRELDLFVFSEIVGSGLPLFTPKGTILRDKLIEFSEKLQKEAGFQKVWIPHLTKEGLYKKSGHWEKFGNELFLVKSQETSDKLILKPMNCPHHAQIYASLPRSYKDLPIRYYETTTVYRDEKKGELGGLSRVRAITQDDAHVFCTLDQIEEELLNIMNMVKEMYKTLNLPFKLRLSFRDSSDDRLYLGKPENWKKAEMIIENVAKKLKIDYVIAKGEAAFYGPKLDVIVIDSQGREWQCATPQLDFVQPERLGLEYIDEDNKKQIPVIIHKALLGSIERFLSVYIEHTQGAFPLWLSPVQVEVLSVSDKHNNAAKKVHEELMDAGVRSELNTENKMLGAKIREATLQKVPYIVIIGDKEIAVKPLSVSVRNRKGETKLQELTKFIQSVKSEIEKTQ